MIKMESGFISVSFTAVNAPLYTLAERPSTLVKQISTLTAIEWIVFFSFFFTAHDCVKFGHVTTNSNHIVEPHRTRLKILK